ncbi:MAG: hypothetical protein AB7E49_02975 [Campylobacterales bacterium]
MINNKNSCLYLGYDLGYAKTNLYKGRKHPDRLVIRPERLVNGAKADTRAFFGARIAYEYRGR